MTGGGRHGIWEEGCLDRASVTGGLSLEVFRQDEGHGGWT